jgi:hypothetical protein
MIFVQIASYRDSELIPTIKSCIENAKYPDELSFGLCVQYGEELDDMYDIMELHPNIKSKFIHHSQSKGCSWARSICESLYSGEEFTLQTDSHMRFEKDWDVDSIELWKHANDENAIITGYPGIYYKDTPESEWPVNAPQICNVYRIASRTMKQKPEYMTDYSESDMLKKAVSVSGAYIFSKGKVIQNVPHDPELYFSEEEMNLALRYFTHGYNLYHPTKVLSRHFYGERNQTKHWTDNKKWAHYNKISFERTSALVGYGDIDLGIYGLGNKRNLLDYKNYSGIDLTNGIVHPLTIKGKEPGGYFDEEGWKFSYKKIEIDLLWNYNLIEKNSNINLWVIYIRDQHGVSLNRINFTLEDNAEILNGLNNSFRYGITYVPEIQYIKDFIVYPYDDSVKDFLQPTIFPIHLPEEYINKNLV